MDKNVETNENVEFAIFEKSLIDLEIPYSIEMVKKTDPKTRSIIWSANVAYPTKSDGFTKLMGEERTRAFLVSATSIWLRSQNDPRRTSGVVEIKMNDGTTRSFTKAELIELGKQALREKQTV